MAHEYFASHRRSTDSLWRSPANPWFDVAAGGHQPRHVSFTFYQYPKCSTCRRARQWLDDHQVAYQSIDIIQAPPSKTQLKRYWKASGLPLKKLFNTSGQSYRQGGFKEKLKTLSDDEALSALAADGKLIRRPLLAPDAVSTGRAATSTPAATKGTTSNAGRPLVLVGFSEAAYAEFF